MLPAAIVLATITTCDWGACPRGSDMAATTDPGQLRHHRMKSTRDIRFSVSEWANSIFGTNGS